MESYEELLSRMREQYEQESGQAVAAASDVDLRLRVMAGEVYRLKAELQWLRLQAFPHTAQGEWLDRHGELRGVGRTEAKHAEGTISFSRYLPLSFDVVIPKGTVCSTTGEAPVEFETTADATLFSGRLTVNIPARAVLPGESGNVSAGQINTIVTPTDTANYVTNTAPFSGGEEAEPDEPYRVRVLSAFKAPANALNSAWYRDAALAIDGVAAAQAVPRENGANTVGVYVWGQGAAPAAKTLTELREIFSSKRDIGVTVSVAAATQKTVDVKARLKLAAGADFALAQQDAKTAIDCYFAGLTVGSGVTVSELSRAIMRDPAVIKVEFPTTMRDVAAAAGVIPLKGAVAVEEIV